jgi:nucleoredoxin
MQRLASTSRNAIASLPSLNTSDGTAMSPDAIVDRLGGKRVALYFAAGWCPMCTSFEPSLLQFREAAASSGKSVEIIYVPSDRSEADVIKRTKAMEMMSVPIGEEADEMKKRCKIWTGVESVKLGTGRRSGVPAVVVLDSKNGDELAFLPTESQGSRALSSWPLDDADGVW